MNTCEDTCLRLYSQKNPHSVTTIHSNKKQTTIGGGGALMNCLPYFRIFSVKFINLRFLISTEIHFEIFDSKIH